MSAATKLRYGSYRAPPFRLGQKVHCHARGDVSIWRISDGRISWPVGKKGSALSLVLYGDLAKAVRREAAAAVRFWWGVSGSTIMHWRRALGIRITEGDRAVRREYMTPQHNRKMTRAATAVAGLPERRQKIASARRGYSMPRSVREKLRRANLGKKIPASVARKCRKVTSGGERIHRLPAFPGQILKCPSSLNTLRQKWRSGLGGP